jgi:sugar lactone lactonase YvrE
MPIVTLRAEVVLETGAQLGEGPVWDERDGSLWFTDITGCRLHQVDVGARTQRVVTMDQEIGALVPRASGGFALAVRDGFAVWDGRAMTVVNDVLARRPDLRMNDGKCDRHGRFWASAMEWQGAPGQGTLYRLDPDLTVTPVVTGLGIGNGLGWTTDDATMVFTDTLTRQVDVLAYDLATGTVGERSCLVAVPREAGFPDGLCLDSEGFVWVALWDGGAVHRYAPDGSLDLVVELPVRRASCCTFGGPDLRTLYITTAALEGENGGGAVFSLTTHVRGVPPFAFAG